MREAEEKTIRESGEPADAKGPVSAMTRRAWVVGVGSTVALLGVGSLRFLGSTPLLRPPGGQDEEALVSKCVHCNRCIEVCPQRIIAPQRIEQGVLGTRTPRLVFSDNTPGIVEALKLCDFCAERNDGVPLCVEVCPSSALSLPDDFDPATYTLGTAVIDRQLCLAYRSGFCSFCYDACLEARGEEHVAIYYADAEQADASRLPRVDADACNGCGACESVCVSVQAGSTRNRDERAIVVKSQAAIEAEAAYAAAVEQ